MRIFLGSWTLTLATAAVAAGLLLPSAAVANVFSELDEPVTVQSGPTISIATDKTDYAPGELVTVTGSGWQPGESVALSVVGEGGEEPWQYDTVVTADENGDVVDRFNIAGFYVPQYSVTATGEFSGVATTSFTDTMGDYRQGTAAAGGTSPCSNAGNVLTSDDLRATCLRNTSDPAQSVIVSGFNLQSVVPSGATNIRFNVEVEGNRAATGGDRPVNIALSSNASTFTTGATNTPAFSTGADQVRTFPSTSPANCDDFGRSWTWNDLDDTGFRVRAMPAGNTLSGASIDIDRIRIRVCYDGSNITDAAAAAQLTAVASPSATVQASVRLHLQGTGAPDWEGTTYQFDSGPQSPCVNTADEGGGAVGNRPSHDFPMTAPAARDTPYNITFRAYPDDSCTEPLVIQPFTLTNGLTVGIFGDSFGINTADNNYDDNTWTDGDVAGQDCRVESIAGVGVIDNDRYLRLRSACEQTRFGINTTGLANIHLKYRWGQDTTVASPGNLTVQWKKSTDGSWSAVNTHSLPNSGGVATIPNSVDFALPASANNTSIDIRFIGPTPPSSPDTQRALVDDVLVTGSANRTVSGVKFNDLNHDGVKAGGEPLLDGWMIKAYAAGADGVLSASEAAAAAAASATTGPSGAYSLSLAPGKYVICEQTQSGYVQSKPAPGGNQCQLVSGAATGGYALEITTSNFVDQDFGNYQPGSVAGVKFNDLNHDGSRDADGADDAPGGGDDEVGLENWVIKAYAAGADGVLDSTEAAAPAAGQATTDSSGAYSIDLPSGKYVVCEELKPDWTQSKPAGTDCDLVADPVAKAGYPVELDPNEDETGKDFGNYQKGSVSGIKFDDLNHDGSRDADGADNAPGGGDDEVPLSGWVINAYDAGSDGVLDGSESVFATATTNGSGAYSIDLPSGKYVICEVLQNDWRQTAPPNSNCQDVLGAGGGGHAVVIDPNEDELNKDFGNSHLATVRGLKFNDLNHDGVQDPDGADDAPGGGDDEEPLDSWKIRAYADGADGGVGVLSATEAAATPVVVTQTNGSGQYTIKLLSGAYVICEELESDWRQSLPSNTNCDAVADPVAKGGHPVDLDPAEQANGRDFGNFQPATVSGLKFNDLNHDGSRDADGADDAPGGGDDEVGLENWVIKAYVAGADGVLDGTEAAAPAAASTTTDGSGAYTLELPSGKYVICEELQSDWRQSAPSNSNCDLVADPVAKGGYPVELDPNEDETGKNFGNYQPATVSGIKFDDLNHDGSRDADGADNGPGGGDDEDPLSGWVINAYDAGADGELDGSEAVFATDTTDSTGAYSFVLPSGKYVICEELQNDWRQTTPSNLNCDDVLGAAPGGHAVELDPNEDVTSGVDFGNSQLATVRGLKFNDLNHDGSRDADGEDDAPGGGDDEEPIDGWGINAYADGADGGVGVLSATEAAAVPVVHTQTNGSGLYTIKLLSGTYVVCEEPESGWRQSFPTNAKCQAVDADAPGGHAVDLDPGEQNNANDFGNFQPATVSGLKFNDLNHDGSRDADGEDNAPGGGDDEEPLDGWTIEAYADDGNGVLDSSEAGDPVAASTTTALDGTYELELPSGTYVICEQLEADWAQSAPDPADKECEEASDAHGGHAVDLDPDEDLPNQNFGNHQPATVSGIKFNDFNHDGSRDADGADNAPGGGDDEEPLDGWTIEAYVDDGDGALDDTEGDAPVFASDVTDSNGAYELTLPSGTYVICEQLEADWAQSAPDPADKECTEVDGAGTGGHAVDLDPNEDVTSGVDFGNYQPTTVSGIKFNDLNHDGSRDADGADNAPGGGDDEDPLSGWVIKAYAAGADGELDATEAAATAAGQDTTDGSGAYSIDLPSGKYVLCEELQNGYAQSKPANTNCDLVADPVAKGGHTVDLDPDEALGDQDFGNYQPATVSGLKFNDFNHDGSRDADGENNTSPDGDDEVGLSGWVIKAYAAGADGELDSTEAAATPAGQATTGSNGAYSIALPSGKYVICEELMSDWTQSKPNNSDCDLVADPVAKGGYKVDLDPSESVPAQDFGNYQKGSVSGLKFNDFNHDGSRDANGVNDTSPDADDEVPLDGWVIKAYEAGADGVLNATEAAATPAGQATTDSNGAYTIDLPSGKYVVCEELKAGWAQSKPANSYCDLVADPVAKGGHQVTLAPNQDVAYKDFGNYQPGSVAGIKFDDRDKNGTKGSGEPVLSGWVIKAYADGGDGVLSATEAAAAAVDTDTTASDGTYKLDLPSGKYVVCEQLVSGWRQSAPSGTACANLADPAADGGHAVPVDPDQDITDKNFGNYRRATVTVRKSYSDGTTMTPVNVKLECTNGFAETKQSTPGSPGSPAVFTVDGFATGDTCSVTEVSSPAGWTPDTSGCAITLTAGGTPSCTVVNVPETTIVTAGGCTFDRDTSRQGFQFPLIFTPDGGYNKLNATNPGQFFLNVAYDGDQGDDIEINIPFPFVLNGTNAIKVYQGVDAANSSGKTCYSPTGSLLSQPSAQYTWTYGTGGNNFGDTKKLTVDSPEDGLVYIRIHMAYGLKGVASNCAKGSTSPPQATCQSPRANFLIGDAPTVGYEQYMFTFNGPHDSGNGKVESYNEFKKNPGIGGLVASTSTGLPFTDAKADVYQGNSKVGTVYTDADGWYMWSYKYTGKAATFTVKLPNNGNAQQSATLKSNGFLTMSFALP